MLSQLKYIVNLRGTLVAMEMSTTFKLLNRALQLDKTFFFELCMYTAYDIFVIKYTNMIPL